jgi:hypothetical protein
MLQLLIIILIGGVIGYFLGRSKYGDNIQDTLDRSKATITDTYNKTFRGKKAQPIDTEEDEG